MKKTKTGEKFSESEIADFKKHLTVKEIEVIAERHGYKWQSLYYILNGTANKNNLKTVKDPESRTAMIKECESIVATRKANHIEVISKTVK